MQFCRKVKYNNQELFWKLWFTFRLFRMGKSFPSSFFIFLDSEPKLVIPNRPRISAGWSLQGSPSQLPLGLEMTPENLSSSLSQEMHLSCFLVRRASFQFSSSSEMTRMIYLILDSRKRRAFLTQSLSLFRQISSFICTIRYYIFRQYLSQSDWLILPSSLALISLMFVNTSVCRFFSFYSSLDALFSFIMLVSSLTVFSFSSSLRQLKERRSSMVSSFAHSFTISGLISLILSFMPSELWLFSLFQRASFLLLFLLRTFRFSVTSFKLTSNNRIFSPHFYKQDSALPLRKSLRPLPSPFTDSSITMLPLLLYIYPRSCNSLLRSLLRLTRGLLGEKEESLGVFEAMLLMLGATICPF